MKYSYAIMSIMLFGMFGLVFIVLFETLTINNESEYYSLKEAMEASMLESVDIACFRNSNVADNGCNGSLKISEQKFVENFTRRFVNSVSGDVSQYSVEFYDIIESPPKATVVIKSKTQDYVLSSAEGKLTPDTDKKSFEVINNLSGILESRDWKYMNDNDLVEE